VKSNLLHKRLAVLGFSVFLIVLIIVVNMVGLTSSPLSCFPVSQLQVHGLSYNKVGEPREIDTFFVAFRKNGSGLELTFVGEMSNSGTIPLTVTSLNLKVFINQTDFGTSTVQDFISWGKLPIAVGPLETIRVDFAIFFPFADLSPDQHEVVDLVQSGIPFLFIVDMYGTFEVKALFCTGERDFHMTDQTLA